MAFGGNETAIAEAEEVIQKWLKDVDTAADNSLAVGYRTKSPVAVEEGDLLGSMDWDQGNVTESAKNVVEGLLRKNLWVSSPGNSTTKQSTGAKRSHDPRIAMDMRHEKVKERHRNRDYKQKQRVESELLQKQAQREQVRREERQAREKTAREEKLMDQQVKIIRSHFREKQKVSRRLALKQRNAIEREIRNSSPRVHSPRVRRRSRGLEEVLPVNSVVLKAEEFVASERKRQRTRSQLILQLEETMADETKQNIKLVHHSFSLWYEVVLVHRARLKKVLAVREWRVMVRVWGAWKRLLVERKARRERDMATKEMKRTRRKCLVALEHYESRLLLKMLFVWRSAVRLARDQRTQLETQQGHREKMDALLKKFRKKDSTGESPQISSSTQHVATPPPRAAKRKSQPPKLSMTPEPAIWQVAKDQLTKLISEVDLIAMVAVEAKKGPPQSVEAIGGTPRVAKAPHGIVELPSAVPKPKEEDATTATTATSASTHSGQLPPSQCKVTIKRASSKPVTIPVIMTGMISRTAAISERKAARERRRENLLQEKQERLAMEEKERQEAEQAAKEAMVQKRKDERRLAREREAARIEKRRHQREIGGKASDHYRMVLLRKFGLAPWHRFCEQCKISKTVADQLHMHLVQKEGFRKWVKCWETSVANKVGKAMTHHMSVLFKRMWKIWMEHVANCRDLEQLAIDASPRLLMKRIIHAWYRVTKEERMEEWEKLARARRFRQRYLQRQVLKVWLEFIPVSREQRTRELRRIELRRKVTSWLADFQPQPPELP